MNKGYKHFKSDSAKMVTILSYGDEKAMCQVHDFV